MEAYDPTTDSWVTQAPMATGHFGFGAAAIGSRIFVAGGSDRTAILSSVLERAGYHRRPAASHCYVDKYADVDAHPDAHPERRSRRQPD